jgi:DNA-binding MarR family transcriptional regulator
MTAKGAPADLTDREYRTLAQFRHALRVFLHFSEAAARSEGLTPNQHQLLLAIRGFSERQAPTITDAAEFLQLQHHSVVELVDRAVDAGLVVRRADPDDRRRQRLALTAKGARTLARLSAAHREELRLLHDELFEMLRDLR